MIYHILYPLHTDFAIFNVFKYITFRSIYATITALVICLWFGPWFIRKLAELKKTRDVRSLGALYNRYHEVMLEMVGNAALARIHDLDLL